MGRLVDAACITEEVQGGAVGPYARGDYAKRCNQTNDTGDDGSKPTAQSGGMPPIHDNVDAPHYRVLSTLHAAHGLPPVALMVVNTGGEEGSGKSYVNREEIVCIAALLRRMEVELSRYQVALVSPYRAQVREMKRTFFPRSPTQSPLSVTLKGQLEINTIDGFQGRECDIVFLSTVRTRSMGFVADARRLNVVATRAKRHFVVVGNIHSLGQQRRRRYPPDRPLGVRGRTEATGDAMGNDAATPEGLPSPWSVLVKSLLLRRQVYPSILPQQRAHRGYYQSSSSGNSYSNISVTDRNMPSAASFPSPYSDREINEFLDEFSWYERLNSAVGM